MFNGYVLHTKEYRETSLIVKIFTKEHGIVDFVAYGAKRKTSVFYNTLRPFIPLLLYWKYRNHIELNILHSAEPQGAAHQLSRVYLFSALYVNELLLKLLAIQDPHTVLFNYYQEFLINLANASKLASSINASNHQEKFKLMNIQLAQNLRLIEKQILKAIGYELLLDRESFSGASIDVSARYFFDIKHGLAVSKISTTSSMISTEYVSISGKSLLALHHNTFVDDLEMQEAKLFMRMIISYFLGNKPLITRKLFC